jgi:hypothetical protein
MSDVDFIRRMRAAKIAADSISDLQHLHLLIIDGDVIIRHVDEPAPPAPARQDCINSDWGR